jgi:hypothetical protein
MALVVRFNIFRWIAIVGVVVLGLAACSGEISEPEDSSAIRPLEESVPAPTTAAPTSAAPTTVVALTTAAPTTAAPTTSAAPTTTTEAPYDGRFNEEELEIIEAFVDAEEAMRIGQGSPADPDNDARLAATHDDEARLDRLELFERAANENRYSTFTNGVRVAEIEVYDLLPQDSGDVILILCLIDGLVVFVNGEVTFDTPWALGWQITMTERESTWVL